jgi:Xanthosine triphosphate pyrophosphatase
VFVTHNKGKIASAQKYLSNVKLTTYEYDLDEPRSDDIKEIAKVKVIQAYELVKKPCIALDAGFFIEELNGFPRAFVNFALDTLGIDGILRTMQGIKNRKCCFKECLAYNDGKDIFYFYGNHPGTLTNEIRGNDTSKKWSDLWYIYIPDGYDKTLAEMTDCERDNRKRNETYEDAILNFAKYMEKKESD